MDSVIGTNIIKVTGYDANFAEREVSETPVIPAWNDLQSCNTVLTSSGYGRNKYSIQAYTVDGSSMTGILGLYKAYTTTAVNIYVQDILKVAGNYKISKFKYSTSTADMPQGGCKYNMSIEIIEV